MTNEFEVLLGIYAGLETVVVGLHWLAVVVSALTGMVLAWMMFGIWE